MLGRWCLPCGERVAGDMAGDILSHPWERRSAQTCPAVLGWSSGGRSDLNHCWVSQPVWQQSVWGLLLPPGGELVGQTLPAGAGLVSQGQVCNLPSRLGQVLAVPVCSRSPGWRAGGCRQCAPVGQAPTFPQLSRIPEPSPRRRG